MFLVNKPQMELVWNAPPLPLSTSFAGKYHLRLISCFNPAGAGRLSWRNGAGANSLMALETGKSYSLLTDVVAADASTHFFLDNGERGTTPVLDIRDFGAYNLGSRDNTEAILRTALEACRLNASVFLPPLPYPQGYELSDTILLAPQNGAPQCSVYWQGQGLFNLLTWRGGSNKAVFHAPGGLTGSTFHNVKVVVPNDYREVPVWDITTEGGGLNNHNGWYNNHIKLGTGEGNVGNRLDHVSGPGADVSFLSYHLCKVEGGGRQIDGQRGFVNEGGNSFNVTHDNCFTNNLQVGYTNQSTPGASSAQGGASLYYANCGMSANETDYLFQNSGNYQIYGGRGEKGNRFLRIVGGTDSPVVDVRGVQLESYRPLPGSNGQPDGYLMVLQRPGNYDFSGLTIRNNGEYDYEWDSRMIFTDSYATNQPVLVSLTNSVIRAAATTTSFCSSYSDAENANIRFYGKHLRLLDNQLKPSGTLFT